MKKSIFLLIIILVVAGCLGPKKEETIVTKIIISADKKEIRADGVDEAVFAVKLYDQNNKEIVGNSLKAAIHDVTTEYYETLNRLSEPKFKTKRSGQYYISAKIGNITSAAITVSAVSISHIEKFSIEINENNLYTNSTAVLLSIIYSGTEQDLTFLAGDKASFSNDGINWSDWENFNVAGGKQWTIPPVDGLKRVYGRFMDIDGNISATQIYDDITLDTTPPVGSISINDGTGLTTSQTVTVRCVNVADTSGVQKMSFSNDNLNWSEWYPYAAQKNWVLSAGDGDKRVYAKFMDNAGNESKTEISTGVRLDSTPPEGTMVINGIGVIYTTSQSVTIVSNITGCALMAFSNDNSQYTQDESYSAVKGEWQLSTGDGIKKVWGRFRDINSNERIISAGITLDATPPNVAIIINNGAQMTNTTMVSIAVSADDLTSGVKEMRFSSNNRDWSEWEGFADTKTYDLPSTGGAEKSIYCQVKDGAGNISSAAGDTIILDNEPPKGSVNIKDNLKATSSSSVIIEINITDNVTSQQSIKMAFRNENSSSYSAWEGYGASKNWTLSSEEGDKTIFCKFIDLAGNEYVTSAAIKLDKSNPYGSFAINSGKTITSKSAVTLSFSAIDVITTVVAVNIRNDSGAWNGWEEFSALKSWTLNSGDGDKSVGIKYRDLAGNESSEISGTIKLDTIAPVGTITISGGKTVTSSQAVSLAILASDANGVEKMAFGNDSSALNSYENYSTSKVWTLTANDGIKTIWGRFMDSAGNESLLTSAAIILDTTPPSGSIMINNGAVLATSSSVTLNISASDALSTVAQMNIKNESGEWNGWESYGATKTWVLSSIDGEKSVSIKFRDSAGNENGTPYTASIRLDTSPVRINNGESIIGTRDVTLTLNAPIPNCTSMSFSNDTKNTFDWTPWETYSTTKVWKLSAGDGTKKVYARFKSATENTETSGADIYAAIKLDVTPPTGTIVINNGDSYTNQTGVAISLSASDTSSTVKYMRFGTDGTTWGSWEEYNTVKNYTISGAGDAVKIVYVEYKDEAGNISSPYSDSIIYDITPPTGTISINSGASATRYSSVTLNLNAGDNITPPVMKMAFKNENGDWSGWEDYAVSKLWTLSSTDGEKSVYVKYRDGAGNESQPVKATVTLDTTSPTGNIVINGEAGYTNSGTLSLTLNINDSTTPVVTMKFSNDNTTWSAEEAFATTKTWSLALGASDGTKTVYAKFKDVAGNEYSVTDTIVYDTNAPTGVLSINNGNAATGTQEVVLSVLTSSDALSGIGTMQFSNDNVSWSAPEPYLATKTWNLASGADGTRTIYMKLIDKAGNTSGAISDTILLDVTAPSGTISINGGAGTTTSRNVTLTLSALDATSGVDKMRFSNDGEVWTTWIDYAVSYNWQISSAPGNNTVLVEYKDQAGNTYRTSDNITYQ